MKRQLPTERQRWRRKLFDAAPKNASVRQKVQFADTVLARLGTVLPLAWRAQHIRQLRAPLTTALQETLDSISKIESAILADQVGAHYIGLHSTAFVKESAGLRKLIQRALRQLEATTMPSLPGRNSTASIVVATMLAREYRGSFDQGPGWSKRSDADNPFTRICDVVSDLCDEIDHHEVHIGEEARRRAIDAERRLWGNIHKNKIVNPL